MMCMMALKCPAAAHIATYISQLEIEERSNLLGLFRGRLEVLYRRDGVREWLSEHVDSINPEVMRLVDYLENDEDMDAYKALDLLRVCELPQ